MTPLPNTIELKDIMSANQLRIADVAKLLDRKPKTVRMWRSEHGPAIPDSLLKLLKLQLLDPVTSKQGSDA